jgi:gluconolactonase
LFLGSQPRVIETRVISEVPAKLRKQASGDPIAGGRWQEGGHIDCLIEGPCFDRDGNLYMVDIPYGRIFRMAPDGEWTVVVSYDGEPNGLRFLPDGRLAIADYKHGILSLDLQTREIAPIVTRYRSERLKGPNDLVVSKAGDIYFTDQGQTGLHDPTGRVFRLRQTGELDCILSNGPSPNGLVLTSNEKFLFVAMTRDNSIWRLPLTADGGTMKVGRFSQYFGIVGPDGVALDQDGNLFVAHASLGQVFVHDKHGELIARIVSCRGRMITNLTFGGPDRTTVFITESETGSILSAEWPIPGI